MNELIIEGILSVVADRRTRDLRFRQRQLISLHGWIAKHVAELEAAISTDDGYSTAEAQVEIAMALKDLKENYESLDLRKELDVEFRIKNGRNNKDRRVPHEIVYVIPSTFTLLYSVMSVLCASIAAGCCCIVEVCAANTPFLASSYFDCHR
jgi:acyl-CoA reductase-like NAD-dependent aldehyde dehydrogenase